MDTMKQKDWAYIVKSRTGSKMFPFATEEEAEEAAKRKSSAKTIYLVYHEGKCLKAYANKKALPEWKTIYMKKISPSDYDKERYERVMKRTYEGGEIPFVEYSRLVNWAIDVCETKIRVTFTNLMITIMPSGSKKKGFKKESVTIHDSGRVVYYLNGKVTGANNHFYYYGYDEEIQNVLYEEMMHRKPELKQVLENCRDLKELIDGYSHPNSRFITDDYKHLIRRRLNVNISYNWFPNKLTNEGDLIPSICKKLRIPCTKTLKKMYNVNFENIAIAKELRDMGFKDVNNILKLSHIGHAVLYANGKDIIHKIARKLIQYHGENWLANKLANEDDYCLYDTARMAKGVDERIINFACEGCKNLAELHDTVMANFSPTHKKKKNREFVYTPEQKKRYNRTYGNVKFVLAKDCEDLAITGAKMGICVGSYARAVLSNNTIIVKMMDENNYSACIEINNEKLCQLKAKFNNPVEAKYKNIIDLYLADSKTDNNCWDYERIGERWCSNHNYAAVDPRIYHNNPQRQHRTLEIVRRNPQYRKYASEWQTEPYIAPTFAVADPDEFPF